MENKRSDYNANVSYRSHESHIENYVQGDNAIEFNKTGISYMVHSRTLSVLAPLLKTRNTWLTIGDFVGFEANFLRDNGQDATASDLSTAILAKSYERGFIDNFRKENVENIDLDENSMDYVLCKEAYHHFPRAFLGMYEMIRVAGKAAILIEPLDILSKMPLLLKLKNFCDLIDPQLINKIWKNRFSFEKVGNYVFKMSEREVEKIAMGLGLPCIAFKGSNILLDLNSEDESRIPADPKLVKKINKRLKRKDLLSKSHLIPYNTLNSVIFKEMPSEQTLQLMKEAGYKIIFLPKNPYIKK